MIISREYFRGIIPIAGSIKHPDSNLEGGSKLDLYIEEYERDILIKTLGYHLYSELQSNLEIVNGVQVLKASADSKWNDLFNGKIYTINDELVRWDGLVYKDAQNNLDRSLIAYYVYAHYLSKNQKKQTRTGTKSVKGKNAENSSPTEFRNYAWNKFYELTVCGNNGLRSLYQFIEDMNDENPETYPNWSPTTFKRKNFLGI